jgi:hypothetical protein
MLALFQSLWSSVSLKKKGQELQIPQAEESIQLGDVCFS